MLQKMFRLSLRQRLLANPLLGLILVLVLTGAYLWHAESSSRLIVRTIEGELVLLDRYTDLVTQFSRHHMTLHQLLYEAPGTDTGTTEERGAQLVSDIGDTIAAMERLLQQHGESAHLYAVDDGMLSRLIEEMKGYTTAMHGAVEMALQRPTEAAQQMSVADRYFSQINADFELMLDSARGQLTQAIDRHVAEGHRSLHVLAVVGLLISLALLFVGYFDSARLSARLQELMVTLNEVSRNSGIEPADSKANELSHMYSAIKVFRESLRKLGEQEEMLTANNVKLIYEIDERMRAEEALLEVKQHLEEKVAERTQDLTQANDTLRAEVQQRMRAERRLTLYKKVIDHTDEAILITNSHGRIVEVNPAYERKLGYDRLDLLGQTTAIVKSGLHDEAFYKDMWDSLNGDSHYWSGEIWNKTKSGELIPFWMTINAVTDDDGNPFHFICLARDISELKEAKENLEQLAYYDPLTGLPNRALFDDRLNQMIIAAKRHRFRLAVLFVDLDRFKDVNDTLGHSVGDALLIQVAQRLSEALRSEDTVSRLGGDEFTIILPEVRDEADVMSIADKLIHTLREPFTIGEHKVQIGGSAGVALFPEHGEDAERLKKNADAAMYQAKEFGRNRCQLFDPELQQENMQRRGLLENMREALIDDGFTLHYQPIVNLDSKRVEEVETLIRWQDKSGKWISPSEFIPVAEEHGLITEIDNWVIRQACEFAVRSPDMLRVHVNMSANMFQNPKAQQMVFDHLDATGLDPERLCIEITETAVIADPSAAREIVEQIRSRGVSFALDDFGTGYSSLTHLTRFPLQLLKIDRSFVYSMLYNDATEAVIRSMVQLAHNMRIKVVAEGVEQEEQHLHLLSMGCEFGQGNFYAEPMTEETLLAWLRDRHEKRKLLSSA